VSPANIAQSRSLLQLPPQAQWEAELAQRAVPPSAPPSASAPDFRHLLGDAIGMRGQQAQKSAFQGVTSEPTSGLGQLLTGRFQAAQQNPEASPATQALAQAAEYLSNSRRVNVLTQPVPGYEKLYDMFAGNQASRDAIAQREVTAAAFRDPLVQQHLMAHPNALIAAETDPDNYSRMVQQPAFIDYMKKAQGHYADIQANGATHTDDKGTFIKTPNDVSNTARIATMHGVSPVQALAATEPHQFSREEFARAVTGMPSRTVTALFGHQLQQAADPKTATFRDYFGTLRADYDQAVASKMPQKEIDKRRQAIQDARERYLGMQQKQFALPPVW